jgi:hypothetical protein
MRPRLYNLIAACLLIVSVGGHWAFAQSLAWTGMLVTYSQEGTFQEAVQKTFDGAHPCKLCKAIDVGKTAEKESQQDQAGSDLKITLFLVEAPVLLWSADSRNLARPDSEQDFLVFATPPHLPPRTV